MQKWYLVAIVAVVTVGVGAIIFLDHTQLPEVNTELTNKIIGILTAVLPVLLLQLSNAAKIEEAKREVVQGQQEIKKTVENQTGT